MEIFYFVLLLLALVCFAVAAARHRSSQTRSVDLIALGLALWVAVPMLQSLSRLAA